jgi:hypothetical protein
MGFMTHFTERSFEDSIEVDVVLRFVEMPGETSTSTARSQRFDGAANTEE